MFDQYIICTSADIFHGLGWNHRYQIVKGICQGLGHVHDEMRVVHGDIKPGNILLADNLVPFISDFGLSRSIDEEHSGYSSNISGEHGIS